MASGVFGLKKVYKRQVENINNGNFASWPEGGAYGYFGGGTSAPGGDINTISRLDFFSETVGNPGNNLPTSVDFLAATSSSSYGYFGGGDRGGTIVDTIRRLDFSNETLSNPGKNLPSARQDLAAMSSNLYGYFGGGNTAALPTLTIINTISRLDFSNETVSNPGKNLPNQRYALAATSSSSYGYFGGGETPSPTPTISTITRLDFSNETVSDPGKNLGPSTVSSLAAVSSSLYGYFGGGQRAGAGTFDTVSKLDFSNESVSNPGNNLPSARSGLAAVSSNLCGYFGGGNTASLPTLNLINTISRLDFSNETVTNPVKSGTGNLPSARSNFAAFSGGQSVLRGNGFKTYGYFVGGGGPAAAVSTVDRLDFFTETASPNTNFLQTVSNRAAASNNNYGYIAAGAAPVGADATRFDYSNETYSPVPSISFSSIINNNGTATSSNSYAYIGGGASGGSAVNTISRLDFSNETTSLPGKNLSTAREFVAATSNNSYGYFAGGRVSQAPFIAVSTINRLDFSNEIVNTLASTLGSSPSGRFSCNAGENGLYGYFFGGQTSGGVAPNNDNRINRLDFSTDITSVLSNRLPNTVSEQSVVSGNSFSYLGGGDISPGAISTITRFNFNTEIASNTSAVLSTAKSNVIGLSNSN